MGFWTIGFKMFKKNNNAGFKKNNHLWFELNITQLFYFTISHYLTLWQKIMCDAAVQIGHIIMVSLDETQ